MKDLDYMEENSRINTDKVRSAAIPDVPNLKVENDPWDSDLSGAKRVQILQHDSYLNFNKDFKHFSEDRKDLLAFKACSLFSKNKLLEHPMIHILCDTSLKTTRSTWEVQITLTYIPMVQNLNISSRMITYEAIESIPKFLNNVSFSEPLIQSFSIKMIGCIKSLEFPKIAVSLQSMVNHAWENTRLEIPVPFTINKFISFESVPHDFMIDFIQNSLELRNLEISLDNNLLVRAEDIIELLPNVLVFEEGLFCFFLDFGGKNTAALKVEVTGDLAIKVILYSSENDPLFDLFMDWFTWMFQKPLNA